MQGIQYSAHSFQAFNENMRVSVVDGGFNAWKADGGEIESGPVEPAKTKVGDCSCRKVFVNAGMSRETSLRTRLATEFGDMVNCAMR